MGMTTGEALNPYDMVRLPSLINALGEHSFAPHLMDFLSEMCGADHFAIFRVTKRQPYQLIGMSRDGTQTAHRQSLLYISEAFWRSDAMMRRAQLSLNSDQIWLDRSPISGLPKGEFRTRIYDITRIRERTVLFGGGADHAFLLSILRSSKVGIASQEKSQDLEKVSNLLVSVLRKHITLIESQVDASLALTSLDEILDTIPHTNQELTKREVEVCARILYGMSTTGIALDLGIGEETVSTYRKRAYQRIGIASQRELIIWYLRSWSLLFGGGLKNLQKID